MNKVSFRTHSENSSTSLAITEMKLKIISVFHVIPVRMTINVKTYDSPVWWHMPIIQAFVRQRQAYHCEFEGNLVYKASLRTAIYVTQGNPVSKRKKKGTNRQKQKHKQKYDNKFWQGYWVRETNIHCW